MKAVARHLLGIKAVGAPTAVLCGWLGATRRRGRILDLCGYMPATATVRIPARITRDASFRMRRGEVTDQIAWRLWCYGWRGFEQPLPEIFAIACREATGVLDIGANSGLYSLIAAAVNPGSAIHAFEPLPAALAYLRRNVTLNGFQTRIKIVDQAIADRPEQARFFVPAGNDGLLEMSASLNGTFRSEHSEVIEVPVTTVDAHVQAFGPARVDVMKIDVESQEHRVLAGARQVLKAHRPLVFLEVLEVADAAAIDAVRRECRYAVLQIGPGGLQLRDRVSYSSDGVNQLLCPTERVAQVIADLER